MLRTPIIVNHQSLASLFVASFAVAVAGCGASSTANNASSLTAADVAGASASNGSSAETAPSDAKPEAAAAEAKPAEKTGKGEVVCRVKDSFGVVNELSITWTSEGGKGWLKRITPSGMEEELRVRAERDRDLVIADTPNETDLMSHVAVVSRLHGKLQMRVGSPTPAWFPCE